MNKFTQQGFHFVSLLFWCIGLLKHTENIVLNTHFPEYGCFVPNNNTVCALWYIGYSVVLFSKNLSHWALPAHNRKRSGLPAHWDLTDQQFHLDLLREIPLTTCDRGMIFRWKRRNCIRFLFSNASQYSKLFKMGITMVPPTNVEISRLSQRPLSTPCFCNNF